MNKRAVSVRTYDAEGYKLRAACVCFKDKSQQEVLLVTSNTDTCKWIVPGGGIEPEEAKMLAAEREAMEEAGVRGHGLRFLGNAKDERKKTCTAVFALVVDELLDHYDDVHVNRQRKWFTVAAAKELLQQSKSVLGSFLDNHSNCGGDSQEVGLS